MTARKLARAEARRPSRRAGAGRVAAPSHSLPRLLRLQRTAGNAAVARLVAVQRSCGCGCGGGGGCTAHDATEADGDLGVQRAPEDLFEPAAPGGTTAASAAPMLSKGSNGPAVRQLQIDLNALGATPQLEPDGAFGSLTQTAVKTFQSAHRLVPDGIVGPATSKMVSNERETEPVNFLVPCHTPDRPGPSGPEAEAGKEKVDRPLGGNLFAAPGGEKVNLTLVLTESQQDEDEAAAVGGKVVKVDSIGKIAKALNDHPSIGHLAIISHGGSDGTVRIDITNEKLSRIASSLDQRPNGSIDRIQFLGCNIGNDPAGMSTLKAKTGAGAVEGVNCFLKTQRLTPARRGGGTGAEIETPADLPEGMSQAQFGALLKKLIPVHKDQAGEQITHPNCILGMPPGDTLATIKPDKLSELYFQRKGRIVFRFEPDAGTCWQDLKFDKETKGCKRVQV